MKRILIFSLTASLICFAGLSQQFDKVKLDAYIDTLANHNKFMGSFAVSQNKELIYTKSVGFADVEQGIKANDSSKYRIASISKTFTTVLIFKAIEDNKLDLGQTIDNFFPVINNANKITIANMLCHRSGLTDYFKFLDTRQPKTEHEMIEIISKAEIDFEPDTQTSYSNTNFILLTYILEKIYEKPYATILNEKIINPLGLKNTYLGKGINTKNNECNPYTYWRGSWHKVREHDSSILLGTGGIVSTPIDLLQFSEALFSGQLISPNSLKQMKTISTDRCETFGLHFGMGLIEMDGAYGHFGGLVGFSSVFFNFPDENITFAFTVNGDNLNFFEIFIYMVAIIFNKSVEIPKYEYQTYQPFIVVTDEELDKYLGVYSTEQIPQKCTITKDNGKLLFQTTGEPLLLYATEKDTFEYMSEGLTGIIKFNPNEKTMVINQRGVVFSFVRED